MSTRTSRQRTFRIHEYVANIVYELVRSDANTYRSSNVKTKKAIPEIETNFNITYEPDVWAIATRQRNGRGQIDIFEVWHTQSWEKGFTDLINSALIEDLGHIHIVLIKRSKFHDPWVRKYVYMIKKVLNSILSSRGKKRLTNLTVVEIDDKDLKPENVNRLKKKIKDKFYL